MTAGQLSGYPTDDDSQRSRRAGEEVVPTVTGANRGELALVLSVSAQGTHHGLVIANYGSGDGPVSKQGWARHVDDRELGTITATDSHALFCYREGQLLRRPDDEPIATIASLEQHALVGDWVST